MKKEVTSIPWKSAFVLVLSNIFATAVAVTEQWNLSKLLWIYWGQSVVMGYFNWRRIRCLKEFSTDGLKINDQPVPATKISQRQAANFFAVHYGGFHVGYFVFLFIEKADLSHLEIVGAATCLAVFIFNHWFSFRQNIEKYISRKPNLGSVMSFPYARILPMHLTILVGSYFNEHSTRTLMLFLSLKTIADLTMHLIEHGYSRGKAQHI
jgi:hypothetical protein